jgi:hypothetical protein
MAVTYQAVITSANLKLKNTNNYQKWTLATMLDALNDGVQLMLHSLGYSNPPMFGSQANVSLTVLGEHGPYNLPSDFKAPFLLLDDSIPAQEVLKKSRLTSTHEQGTGCPTEYWLEGFNPTKIYFNSKTDIDRTFVMYYLSQKARETDVNQNIPLPDYCMEPLVQWVVKMCGDIDEYETSTEAQKLAFMDSIVESIVLANAPETILEVEGCGW